MGDSERSAQWGSVPPAARSVGPRLATFDDVEDLVSLRMLMLTAMGEPAEPLGATWRASTADWFRERFADGGSFAAFVVDDPAHGVVAVAAGLCEVRAPSGTNPSGRVGRLFNVSTAPAFRGRGLARACTTALLDWFAEDTCVGMLELSATEDAGSLYTSLGFQIQNHPTMRLTLHRDD